MNDAVIRLANMPLPDIKKICRCCGKNLGLERFMDDAPIHTRCIPKHWGKHAHSVNASRCQEFGR
jgi:hypothetical protein